MKISTKTLAAFGAVALTTSVAAIAQTTADPTVTTAPANDDNDGDEGKWGLLGLLGLAGLLGLKRRDDHRNTTADAGPRRM